MVIADFYVRGTPVSSQAKRTKAAWKAKVASQCPSSSGPPTATDVSVAITYYHDGAAPAVDIDNIIKPIQDAMIGIVYLDDRQVADVRATRINTAVARLISSASPHLIAQLAIPGDFVHIVVDDGS